MYAPRASPTGKIHAANVAARMLSFHNAKSARVGLSNGKVYEEDSFGDRHKVVFKGMVGGIQVIIIEKLVM